MLKNWKLALPLVLLAVVGAYFLLRDNSVPAQIARHLGGVFSTFDVQPIPLEGLGDCEIYDAYDRRMLDGVSVGVARLKNGTLIANSDADALNRVFSHCVTDATPATTLAELITSFRFAGAQTLRNDEGGYTREHLRKSNTVFTPPEIIREGDTKAVRFLALGWDGEALLRIEARIKDSNVNLHVRAVSARSRITHARDRQVVAQIAQQLNWPEPDAYVSQFILQGLGDCEIYSAHDTRLRSSDNVGVARLKDASLVIGTDQATLERVYAQCAGDATPAETLAELVANFSEAAGAMPLYDDSLEYTRQLLQMANLTFTPPQMASEGDVKIVRFLALGQEGSKLFRIEARIRGNSIATSIQPLATRKDH